MSYEKELKDEQSKVFKEASQLLAGAKIPFILAAKIGTVSASGTCMVHTSGKDMPGLIETVKQSLKNALLDKAGLGVDDGVIMENGEDYLWK